MLSADMVKFEILSFQKRKNHDRYNMLMSENIFHKINPRLADSTECLRILLISELSLCYTGFQ